MSLGQKLLTAIVPWRWVVPNAPVHPAALPLLVGYVIVLISMTLSELYVLEKAFEAGPLIVDSSTWLSVVLEAIDTSWLVVAEALMYSMM